MQINRQQELDAAKQRDNAPISAKLFKDSMREHARATKATNSADSYQAMAKRAGYHAIQAFVIWIVIGAPGYPPLSGASSAVVTWIDERSMLVWLGVSAFLGLMVLGYSGERATKLRITARRLFEWPFEMAGTAARLLGVAVIGICAIVPAAVVVHMLNFD